MRENGTASDRLRSGRARSARVRAVRRTIALAAAGRSAEAAEAARGAAIPVARPDLVTRLHVARLVVRLVALFVAFAAGPTPSIATTTVSGPTSVDESPIAPEQRRGVEQTLLTYPEWFLVHSPAEYARDVAVHPSHDFPFIGHVAQLWRSYADVTREQMRRGDPANVGYHVMIVVIATSTTIEYALRAAYEDTIGRLGWALSSGRGTDEDRYQATVAQDYVDFIRREPWYLYDFGRRLRDLWTSVPLTGADPIRKWERRYALTTEFAVKAAYAKLIEKATRAGYEPALLTTQVVTDRVPSRPVADVRTVRVLPDGRALLELPRYDAFAAAATRLAEADARLVDIAGNHSVILVTLWSRDALALPPGSRVLFEQPLLTMPGTRRVAALLQVAALSPFLATAAAHGITVEHVYDY